jgi:alpha-galactosidase
MALISRRRAGQFLLAGCAPLLIKGHGGLNSELIDSVTHDSLGTSNHESPVRSPVSKPPANTLAPNALQQSGTDNHEWSDVFLVEQPEPTISYRTGWVVYEESLTKGQFVGRGWNGAGFINFYGDRIDPGEHPMPQAFQLEIDGQSLETDWKWGGLEKISSPPGNSHSVITLIHALRPVTVNVHTKLDGTAILTRWLEVTNTGMKPAALATARSWSGVLRKNDRWRSHLDRTNMPLYSIGYFGASKWAEEGDFHWHDMPEAGYRIDGRYRRDRWRHPFFMLRNNATGEFFIGELAWTGGYCFAFDLDTEVTKSNGMLDDAACLTFSAGPDSPAPMRIIAPAETIATPEVHLGLVYGDLDNAVQAMHTHLRRTVFMPRARGRGGWVESGIGPEVEITPEQTFHAIDVATQIGAEVFFIDASWYAPPNSDWWRMVGDWTPNRKRFPEGLKPFRDRVHGAGMLWGLWMDAERIGNSSRVAQEHPDWLAMNYDGQRKMGGQLDLTNPEVAKWMENEIVRVISEYECDFFRLDYNTDPHRGIKMVRDGFVENGYWRYYQTLYAIYDRLRARFPDVVFENCAGGGGRTDIGMVRRFDHTDVTDWQIAPRSFMITNGMTMALPPEYMDRLVGGQDGQSAAEYAFQWRTLLFMQPKFGFLYPLGAKPDPVFIERTKHWVDLYKNFVRPFMHTSRIYHHTPEVHGLDPQCWGVLELASEDRTRAICGLFQLSAPTQSEYRLRFRGLDRSRRYQLTFDNSGEMCSVDGFTLMDEGINVRLEGALTSELLICATA